jgi:hypothetical protein
MKVNRATSLAIGEIRGQFLILEPIIAATRDVLIGSALEGIHDGGHEGLVFWGGRQHGNFSIFTTVVVPQVTNSRGGVWVSERAVGDASRRARSLGIALLCQVHSHPCEDARHSEGDDSLITMPFEGMLSVVVPEFGIGFSDLNGSKIHQFQDSHWVLCSAASVTASVSVIPTLLEVL